MIRLTVEEIARVLFEHDAKRMSCMDHDKDCCPTCEAHDFDSAYEHQAEALLKEIGLHYLPDPTVLRCKCGYIPCPGIGESYAKYMDRHLIEKNKVES